MHDMWDHFVYMAGDGGRMKMQVIVFWSEFTSSPLFYIFHTASILCARACAHLEFEIDDDGDHHRIH